MKLIRKTENRFSMTSRRVFHLMGSLFFFASALLPVAAGAQMMPIPVHDFPPTLQLCGEKVPLERQDVWEMMDQAFVLSVYNQEQVILWLKRANRYFPYIEKRLRERKMPDDIKYVAVVESSLRIYAVSSAKATGPWQFMDKTAKRYGLRVVIVNVGSINVDRRVRGRVDIPVLVARRDGDVIGRARDER